LTASELRDLFARVRDGRETPESAETRILQYLRQAPFEDLGFARVDHHRAIRQGFPEVVFGSGKTPAQIAAIAARIVAAGSSLLVTRADASAYAAVAEGIPDAAYSPVARTISRPAAPPPGSGTILVAAAGTADLPVAEEAAVCAEVMGNRVDRLYDVGVAGLHRLLAEGSRLSAARVIIVVAGMEGALPSVIGGLVSAPVIAVPTSVGYGASFGGLAALLGMLNSCATGVAVVNIDNGFGAAALASAITHLPAAAPPPSAGA
jgi:NCAIR mutase (PurE)-related protein